MNHDTDHGTQGKGIAKQRQATQTRPTTDLPPNKLFEQQFLSFLSRKSGAFDPSTYRILAKLVNASINQHSCIDLSIESSQDIETLGQHKAIGLPEEGTPIVIHGQRLYLAKFYDYEKRVATDLIARNRQVDSVKLNWLKQELLDQFGDTSGDRQKLAAFMAITRMLTIITGGPGTGKTSTVVRLLNIMLHDNPNLDIRLAAPTGKAAMRLAEGIGSLDAIGSASRPEVRTLHRLLGVRRDGRSYRYNADNPLQADILIVDEASMIDLEMMDRLLAALPTTTRLILLGDPNQLPSVDTGNVLADLCARETGFTDRFQQQAAGVLGETPADGDLNELSDAICRLNKSYRFSSDSGIAILSENIRMGSAMLGQTQGSKNDTSTDNVIDQPGSNVFATTTPPENISLIDYWPDYQRLIAVEPALLSDELDNEIAALFTAFDQCRILCSRRGGGRGVEALNRQIELELEQLGVKQRDETFYPGRPILITENDYNLSLFNGDIGICLPFQAGVEGVRYLVHFPNPGIQPTTLGTKVNPSRSFLASRLPSHETCFAMTVHKSQGSEFEHVVMVIDDESNNEANNMMTRELLYTGVTRAKNAITLHTTADHWRRAVERSAARFSGMSAFLSEKKLDKSSSDQLNLF